MPNDKETIVCDVGDVDDDVSTRRYADVDVDEFCKIKNLTILFYIR